VLDEEGEEEGWKKRKRREIRKLGCIVRNTCMDLASFNFLVDM
jgi:hypothetical protein